MVSRENVSIRANDHARAEALQRLLALPLRELSSEKLAQRVIGKWKRRHCPRDRLSGEYSDHARRHLLDDRGEAGDNSRLRRRSSLRCNRKHARGDAKHGADQQPDGPENSSSRKTFHPSGESHSRPHAAPFANSNNNEGGTVAATTPQRVGKYVRLAANMLAPSAIPLPSPRSTFR